MNIFKNVVAHCAPLFSAPLFLPSQLWPLFLLQSSVTESVVVSPCSKQKATTFLLEKCVQQCFHEFFSVFVKKDRPLVTVCDNFVTILCAFLFTSATSIFSRKKGKPCFDEFFFTYNVLKSFEESAGAGKCQDSTCCHAFLLDTF